MCFFLLFYLLASPSLSFSVFPMTSVAMLWLDNCLVQCGFTWQIVIITKRQKGERNTVEVSGDKKQRVCDTIPLERGESLREGVSVWICWENAEFVVWMSLERLCMWSGSPLSVMSTIKSCNTKRFRTRERPKTVDILSLCCSYQVTACERAEGHCNHSATGWNLLDPLCCPKALKHRQQPPTPHPSVADMHLGNRSPLSLQDMNSCDCSQLKHTPAHTAASIKHISAIVLQTCTYRFTWTLVCRELCLSSGSHVCIWQECWQPTGEALGYGLFSIPSQFTKE